MTICPHCNKRPLLEKKTAKTCGSKECQKKNLNLLIKRDQEKKRELTKIRFAEKPKQKCSVCFNLYTPIQKTQKVCQSKDCRKEHQRKILSEWRESKRKPLQIKDCLFCNDKFKPPKLNPNKKFCSIRCGDRYWNKQRKRERRYIKCRFCPKLFFAVKDQITCGGNECRSKYITENNLKHFKIKQKEKVRVISCIGCGKEVKTTMKKQTTCGLRKCKTVRARQRMISDLQKLGINNYKPFLNLRTNREYLLNLIASQNNQCVICGNKLSKNLTNCHVDHIYPWKKCIKEKWSLDKINNINNLQVTCYSCNIKKGAKIMKNTYKERANQACFKILDILEQNNICPYKLEDVVKKRNELKDWEEKCYKEIDRPQKGLTASGYAVWERADKTLREFKDKEYRPIVSLLTKNDTFLKNNPDGSVTVYSIKTGYRFIDYLDYFAHNWRRLYGFGIAVSGWIGEEGWGALEKESEEKNKGWIDRDDFGSYFKYKKSQKNQPERFI